MSGGIILPDCSHKGERILPGKAVRMTVIVPPDEVRERVVELRRTIHRHPELGFEEQQTQALVESELAALGIEHRRIASTGVVGVIRGQRPGRVVGLRADMDALPITEKSGEPFASEVPGKMHACGHDAHTAMLLGAARVLQSMRADLHGTVVLLFQPAEEGPGGAEPMIAQGALDDPKVEAVAMLHVDHRLPAGAIGVTPGPVNASADEFYVTVHGRGGHGAYPHTAADAIPAACAIVSALQTIASRETDPLKSVVVTIGTINGGYRNNVIADEVKMSGTLRAHDPEIRNALESRVRRIVDGVAAAYNVRATLEVNYGYPPVVNNVTLAENFSRYMKTRSQLNVERPMPTMGAEDFAYFAQRVPGVHIRLGIRNEQTGAVHSGHSPQFRIDEAALPVGVQTLVAFATAVGSGEVAYK
jgi:amidohydrolase